MRRFSDGNACNRGKKWVKTLEPYLWLSPALLLFSIFIFLPFLETIYKSFFIVDLFGQLTRFVRFENYAYLLKDKLFGKAVVNTLWYTVLTVPISKVLGTLLAYLARKRRRTSFFYEACFAISMAMASSVTAMIFQLLYMPSLGVLNGLLEVDIQWLKDPKIAMISIAIIQIWLSTGYAFIFMLAAVRSVSQDAIEYARVEGASSFQTLVKIYLPLTSPTMFYLVITDAAYSLMMMSLVNVLTDGGPQDSTITIMQYIYKQISAAGNFTNANPAAVLAFGMVFLTTMLGFLWEKKGVFYQ